MLRRRAVRASRRGRGASRGGAHTVDGRLGHHDGAVGGVDHTVGDHNAIYLADNPAHVDTTPPVVTPIPERPPEPTGWYTAPVTINWTATDDSDSVSAPPPVRVATDGTNQLVTSNPVCDSSGNCATGSTTVSVDMTASSLGEVALSTNPTRLGNDIAVTVAVADATSGVLSAVYTLGEDQPALMPVDGTLATVNLSEVPVGVHPLTVTVTDVAGNSATSLPVDVVVYDPEGGFVTGSAMFVPGGPTSDPGDFLPTLDGTSAARSDLVSKYQTGSATTPSGRLLFRYRGGDFD